MTNKLAHRVAQIAPFQVMEILARAKELDASGEDVIHLEVGEPDFTAVNSVANAGMDAIQSRQTGYTSATGLAELKQAIATHYLKKYQVALNPQRIIVTPGASGALSLLASLMVNAGEQVMMPDPCYPCNRHFLIQVGAKAQLITTKVEDAFAIDLQTLANHWQGSTTGLWLASPANPSGCVLSKDYIAKAYQKVSALGGHLMVDEIYQGLVFEGEDFSALSIADDIFVINSFSKFFAMTGWRLGWIVVPEWAIEAATKLAQNFFISAPTVSQYAALQAFSDDAMAQYEHRRCELNERRKALLEGLANIGLPAAVPAQGAFYVYVDVSHITSDAKVWCLALLEAEKVALTPGADFGYHESEKYVRFAYTASVDRLHEAIKRISRFLASPV
ncbi:aspartate aminotransferase [Glaciecola punicea ACAM 611]|jgi:aspartate/methionine/tyrosine aminotransferase|uniref:Aminotransferase n=1 Tax=Glaciecola punicea ACAM 611 TaxID=1121923 RepID=H5TBM6_9ALTE|nr:aminotransferase class I/II-fold pyridoxal phosphate-dependent enzyme [Glaciecola punicea]OFA30932.1 aminotransferase [Glaciecola punicea]GAB55703.1 aspartate aminotransferase [Glaciecola punicea ACAM 611]